MYICRTLPLDVSSQVIQDAINAYTSHGGTLVSFAPTANALVFVFEMPKAVTDQVRRFDEEWDRAAKDANGK